MLANCIPIYYGADDINNHFNEKSFINMNNFEKMEDCIEYIKKIDNDDELYAKMLQENWFNNNTLTNWFSLHLFASQVKKVIKMSSNKVDENKASNK